MNEIILDAIVRANKLGAKGVQVIGYIEPQLATQDPHWMLITEPPKEQDASELPWYER